jgi:hypothetical protein
VIGADAPHFGLGAEVVVLTVASLGELDDEALERRQAAVSAVLPAVEAKMTRPIVDVANTSKTAAAAIEINFTTSSPDIARLRYHASQRSRSGEGIED